MFLEVFLAILIVVSTRTLWLRWKYDLHKIPSPSGLPLLGHTLDFVRGEGLNHFSTWFRKQHKALGFPKIFKVQIGMDDWVFISDIACMKQMMRDRTGSIEKHPLIGVYLTPSLALDGVENALLITKSHAYTKAIRRAFVRGLQISQLRKSHPDLKTVLNRMIQIIETERKEGPIDFQRLCSEFTIDAIGVIAMGTHLGGLDKTRYFHDGLEDAAKIGQVLVRNPLALPFTKFFPNSNFATDIQRRKDRLKVEWDQLTQEILERPDPPKDDTPIWYNIKTTIDPTTNEKLAYEGLRSEFATAVHAGLDTTGFHASWMLGILATLPEITQKLLDELKDRGLYGSNSREVEFEDLDHLPYLDAFIKESIRVASILPHSIHRYITRDMSIFGYRLPKGTIVIFPGNRATNFKEDWGDPEVFRPERWMTDEDMSLKYIIMFQTGPRKCLGQKLAMFELRLLLISLVSKYQFFSDKTYEELLDNTIDIGLIKSNGGMWLDVKPRIWNDQESS